MALFPRAAPLHLLQPLRRPLTIGRHVSTTAGARAAPHKPPRTVLWRTRLAVAIAAHALIFTSAGIYLLTTNLPAISGPIDRTPVLPPAASAASSHTLATIRAALDAHPLFRRYASDTAYTQSEAWSGITDPDVRARKLTAGALAGAKRIMANRVFLRNDNQESVSFLCIGTALCGYPNVVHGGISATVLDEALGRLAIMNFPEGMHPVTARLECSYRRPIEASGTGAGVGKAEWGGGDGGVGLLEALAGLEGKKLRFVVVRCRVVGMEGDRKCRVKGSIEDEAGNVLVLGEGLFVVPRGWVPNKLDAF